MTLQIRSRPSSIFCALNSESSYRGRDQGHGGREYRASRRREAHDQRHPRFGRHDGARNHEAARRYDHGRGHRTGPRGPRAAARQRAIPACRSITRKEVEVIGSCPTKTSSALCWTAALKTRWPSSCTSPLYVPETKNVLKLLSELQEARMQMAIVVDEYGGTDGLLHHGGHHRGDRRRDCRPRPTTIATHCACRTKPVARRRPLSRGGCRGTRLARGRIRRTTRRLRAGLSTSWTPCPGWADELLVDGYAFKVVKMRRSRISIVQVKKLPSASCEESVTTA